MKARIVIALVLALGGCTPAASSTRPTTPAAAARAARDEAAVQALQQQRERNRELSAQLSLARAELGELRDEVSALQEAERRRPTRIARAERCEPSPESAVEDDAQAASSGPRPLLRLYGTAPSLGRPASAAHGVPVLPGPDAPVFLGPPPAATARLPVIASDGDAEAGVPAIPSVPITVADGPESEPWSPPAPPPVDDGVVLQYRRALAHLAERRIPDAISGLDAFLRDHASHPYADNAMYWRAEIDYTRRDFSAALGRFTRLIELYPRGNKVPDALLRIGLCYERMGQRARARRVFSRLRQQYPNTVAARMASREDV